MPPGMFNQFEDNRGADWETMLEARNELENGGAGGADAGQMALVFGAAVLALILIAMVLTSS